MIVSIAIVAYNEEKTLPNLLEEIYRQSYPHEDMEVLLIDSRSTDGTKALMEQFAAREHDFRRVVVLDNPGGTLPYGCNVALEQYTGDAIVRIDAHASIPEDFIQKNVTVLEGGESVCGGQRPNIIDENTPWKQTLLLAEQSMFGSSIASYRHSQKQTYVKSIFHGMYRREVYDKVGMYDVRLTRTEDNDMSYRIRQAGYQICYDPEIISYQHTRSTLKRMLKQKYGNGFWIGRTIAIQPKCFSIYHFVPFLFVLGIVFTTILAVCGLPLLAYLMWGAYVALVLGISAVEIVRNPFSWSNLLLPVLFFLLHVSYGIGTLAGMVTLPFWLRKIQIKTER